MIPYAKQSIADSDVAAVEEALRSNFLTSGPIVETFETEFSSFVEAKHSVAVSSGTAALHIACLAIGISKGDEVIVPALTFAASANCVLYCGGIPIFADVTDEGIIDVADIERKISSRTKAIIPVHYAGLPCDMQKISALAKKHQLYVIEDACHALGSKYENTSVGSCFYSDMACFSFHPAKHITTGEGGIVTTNNPVLADRLRQSRTHGITTNPEKIENYDGGWRQDMQFLGYNYRITDFQCALGSSQLKRLPQFVEKRQAIAKKYSEAFANISFAQPLHRRMHAHHLYVVKLESEAVRKKLYDTLKAKNIFCQVHYLPVYWHSYYQQCGYKRGLCPNAEKLYKTILSLPIYFELTDGEQAAVIREVSQFE